MSEGESERVALVKQALVKLGQTGAVYSDFMEQYQALICNKERLEDLCELEEIKCEKALLGWFWGHCRQCGNRWWESKGVILTPEEFGLELFHTWSKYIMKTKWDTCSCCYKCAGGMNVKKDKLS